MLKSQYIILSVAILLVAGLALLPKVVVNDGDRQLSASSGSAAIASETSEGPAAPMNQIPASAKQQLDELVEAYQIAGSEADKMSALKQLSAFFTDLGRPDSAAWYAADFADLFSSEASVTLAGESYYNAYLLAGSKEQATAYSAKARAYLQQALEYNPGSQDLKVKLGMTWVASENPMQGIMMIREVIRDNPEHKGALMSLGMLSMQSGQYDKAVERFQTLKALAPEDTQARFYLGISLLETGQQQQAVEELRYVQQNETNPQILASVEELIKSTTAQ